MKLRNAFVIFAVIAVSVSATQAGERTLRDIQQALSSKGFNPGTIDGLWGKKSAKALKDFQKTNGLAPTGKINDATIAALFSEASQRERGLPNGTESETTDNERPTEAGADQKTDRLSPKVNAAPGKSVTAFPATAEATPNTVTTTPTIENGASDKKTLHQSVSSYAIAFIVLAAVVLAVRKRKGKTANAAWPYQVDPVSPAPAPDVSRVFTGKFEQNNGELAVSDVRSPATPEVSVSSLAAQNEAVNDWVRQNAGKNTKNSPIADNDALTTIVERSIAAEVKQEISLAAHTAAVKQWVIDNAVASRRRFEEGQQQHFGTRTALSTAASSSAEWKEKDTTITIAGITISKGLIYVGKSLAKDSRGHETENCLINPGLKVAQWGDREGHTMGYWPSYSSITAEARRSYLEWLASDRSDPNAYIGYVFLYFYGLERRLMLERDAPDSITVAAEVRRLLGVYGGNHSFQRYATELLTAVELQSGEPSAHFLAHLEPNGYEVPTAIRIALGVRVRDDRVMEPDLLYRFVVTHPETRIRTPAKRAPALMRQLFAQRVLEEYPSGFRYKAARAKPLQKHYRACSGSFEVDIAILGGNVPDIAHHAQPFDLASRIFDTCSDALDDYSRALSRLPGLTPNLMAISKLPKSLRAQQADFLEGRPLDQLNRAVSDARLITVAEIAQIVGADVGIPPTKSKLREISQLLAAFGFGVTFDPAFATKTLSSNDQALIFPIAADTAAEPTEHFRSAQLAMMLGLVIGQADGHFHDSERDTLIRHIESAPLDADERSRLRAEMMVNEVNPARLDDWIKRLKDVDADTKMSLADELISVAAADGNLHVAEIRKLELVFKRIGLANQVLYDRLHSGSSSAAKGVTSSSEDGTETVPAAKTSTQINLSKLHSIRSETSVAANMLADIFADDDPGLAEPIVMEKEAVVPESEMFDGLEQRYSALLTELRVQASWSVSDFYHLARDAGLMPGAAREAINDWAMDRFDELLIEGDDPVGISLHLLPSHETALSKDTMKDIPA